MPAEDLANDIRSFALEPGDNVRIGLKRDGDPRVAQTLRGHLGMDALCTLGMVRHLDRRWRTYTRGWSERAGPRV